MSLEQWFVDRIKTAVVLPLIVFPVAAVVAIAIGVLLLQLPRKIDAGGLEVPLAPLVALTLVVVVTAAGFIASSRAGETRHEADEA